jgi:peptidyl-prolyl cis-trans isomerase B (cyclophilin B)
MPLSCVRAGRALRHLAAATVLLGGMGLVGCGQQSTPHPESSAEQTPSATTGSQPANDPSAPTVSVPAVPAQSDALHQAFAQATRSADNPPADSDRPPDQTVSKKPVHKLLDAVAKRWDTIRFTTPDGKPIQYRAVVETSLGKFTIALRPDLAPNHVRNFIALAEVGYYEELFVDRLRHDVEGDRILDSIEAGCPLGTGEYASGSIGYWLKDEFQPSEKASHVEGTVGACRSLEPHSAGCRFYVVLSKTTALDSYYTIFGKVVEGLDVVRKIHAQPVVLDGQDQGGARRPEKPIVIRKVTIQRTEGPG